MPVYAILLHMSTKTSKNTVRVVETDQWTSTGNVTDFSMEDFDLAAVQGGDSEAAKAIFGGRGHVIEVAEDAQPSIGNVWFRPDPETGKLKIWRANYDSSD